MSETLLTNALPAEAGGAAPAAGPPRRRRHPWVDFAIRRGLGLVASVIALIVVTFFIVQLIPGDPAVGVAGADATSEQIEAVRVELGLDQPILVQFADYALGVLRLDFGNSFMWGSPVIDVVAARVPFTLSISLIALAVVLVVAVPLGMLVGIATRGGRRSTFDSSFAWVTGVLASVPSYIMATLLVVVFAIGLQLFPPAYSAKQGALSFVLPILALAIGPICTVSRVVRRETAVVLEQDYVRTARGWRLPPLRTYGAFVLPNLITTTLTLSGLILTSMLGSALITETVFAIPGLGSGVVSAILNRDYPVIQGIVLFVGVIAAVMTLLIDVILGLVDPRTLGATRG